MNPLPILRDAWYFFSRHLAAIALLCLPLIVLENLARQLVAGWSRPETAVLFDLLVGVLFYPLYTAALILFIDARNRGLQPRARDLLTMALWLWPTLVLLVGLSSLAILLGFSLLVLPGLWMMAKLAFAEYLLVLRGRSPVQALHESFARTTGLFWPILTCLLCALVPLWLLDGLTQPVKGAEPDLLLQVLRGSLIGFFQLFATVLLFRLFMLVDDRPLKD
ncbi:MAG: hypothetical protein V4812_10525 [Pseudomonadota bacterium]